MKKYEIIPLVESELLPDDSLELIKGGVMPIYSCKDFSCDTFTSDGCTGGFSCGEFSWGGVECGTKQCQELLVCTKNTCMIYNV